MKKNILLTLIFIFINVVMFAQYGTVISYNKISSISGNFYGDLDADDGFGRAYPIGDFDDDGVVDVAVTAPTDDDGGTDKGAVWLLMLNSDETVKNYYKISSTSGNFGSGLDVDDNFGASLCNLGDIDNDGITDIAVGAWGDDDGGTNVGAVWILFLNSNGTVKSKQKISASQGGFLGELGSSDMFGIAVSNLGDMDGDGITDLGVSARGDDDGGTDRGAVWILYLNSNGTVKSYKKISNTEGGFLGQLGDSDWFGRGIARIKDLNSDGVDDLVVGAISDDDGGTNAGAVWVLFMNNDETVNGFQKISATQGNFTGILNADDQFGININFVGDVNGDGISDIVVSANNDDDGGTNVGAFWILFLDTNGTVKDYQKVSKTFGNFTGGVEAGDLFGATVVPYTSTINTFKLLVSTVADDDGGTNVGAFWILTLNKAANIGITSNDTIVCLGDSVILSASDSSAYTYLWSTGDTTSTISVTPEMNTTYFVTITNGSDTIVDNVIVSIYSFDLGDDITTCNESVTITANGNWLSFIWNTSETTSSIQPLNSGIFSVTVVNNVGCMLNDSIQVNLVPLPAANIVMDNNSICNGDQAVIYANSGSNLQYQWYKDSLIVLNEDNSYFIATEQGDYYVLVTDTLSGCENSSQSEHLVVNTTDFNLSFATVPSPAYFTSPPFGVAFDNQTPLQNSYSYAWYFGDNESSTQAQPYHQYYFNGLYTVTMVAQNNTTGCRDTLVKEDLVICTGGELNPCNIISDINAQETVMCENDSILLIENAYGENSLQWTLNNIIIPNAINSYFYATEPGEYRLIASNSQCSVTSTPIIISQYPSVKPLIQADGAITSCSNDFITLSTTVSYFSYNWSTNQETATVDVMESGYYYVSVTDLYGCIGISDPFEVNISLTEAPEICLVTIDTVSNMNMVTWNKEISSPISFYNIYRQSNVSNLYDLVGTVNYMAPNYFIDETSNPAVHSDRYKITSIDTCGNETSLSTYHKTIHLTASIGTGQTNELSWAGEGYEGFNFDTYNIYRLNNNTSEWELIGSVASNVSSYSDLNPPTGLTYYQISALKNETCDVTANKNLESTSEAFSNVADNGFITSTFVSTDFSFTIYPNPVVDYLKIYCENQSINNCNLSVYDVLGNKINVNYSKTNNLISADFSGVSPGTYFIHITDGINSSEYRVIKF